MPLILAFLNSCGSSYNEVFQFSLSLLQSTSNDFTHVIFFFVSFYFPIYNLFRLYCYLVYGFVSRASMLFTLVLFLEPRYKLSNHKDTKFWVLQLPISHDILKSLPLQR